MSAKDNLAVVEELRRAARAGDFDRYGESFTDDAVLRMAGVPAGMGGVIRGRQAIVEQSRSNASAGGSVETKTMFGDDEHVCVVGKLSAPGFAGNRYLKGTDRPFATYQCVVYRLAGGKVAEATNYTNWLDPYVQMGLIDASTLTG